MDDKITSHRYLYNFIKRKVSLVELEQWLYNNIELEEYLGEMEYLEFVSRNYKSKYAFQDTEKQILNLINIGYYEQERIIKHLTDLTKNSEEFLGIMEVLYDDYCDGYHFLRYIAFAFITTSDEYKELLQRDHIKLMDYREPVKQESYRLLDFFEREELKIEIEHNYIDLRKIEDRIELHSIDEMMKKERDV